MSIKLVIFDLDGTLVDSSIDICNAINYAIAPYGVDPVTVSETKTLVGEGISRLMDKVAAKSEKEKISGSELVEKFLWHYSGHLVDNSPVYPGVRETFHKLDNYKKIVVSNKSEDLSIKTLEAIGLAGYLDMIVGSDTTPERKPSAVPIQYALSKLGIKPEEAVIIGDSNFDIQAGKAAGIRTIAVTYGFRQREVLKDADFIVDSMPELMDILKTL